MRSSIALGSLVALASACHIPGGDLGTHKNSSPDLIIQSIEVGKPIPFGPDRSQYAVTLLLHLRNGGNGWISNAQSFDVSASLSVPDPDPMNPIPATAPGAKLVFDRPDTLVLPGAAPPPRVFTVTGPINGKTNFTVARTAYVTPLLGGGTFDLEVVVDWCPSWPNDVCKINERTEGNNSMVVPVSFP